MTSAEDVHRYGEWLHSHPQGCLWQSAEWKAYQEALGKEVRIYVLKEGTDIFATALVIIDRTTFGFSTWDIPRGPIWEFGNRDSDLGLFLNTIVNDARQDRCFCLYLSPQIPLTDPLPQIRIPNPCSLSLSPRHEQPAVTRIIDLTQPEEEILKRMKSKGRYNISVAHKHGIHVEQSEDISAFMDLLKKTGHRDNFTIHPRKHYEAFLSKLPGSFLFLASIPQGKPVAGLLGVIWGTRAIYYYGASDYASRALMAPYALQWAAMRHAKAAGCTSYDLLGVAPPDAPAEHPWQGVSAFKEKFGGTLVTYPPEQEIVLRPIASRLLRLKRKLIG